MVDKPKQLNQKFLYTQKNVMSPLEPEWSTQQNLSGKLLLCYLYSKLEGSNPKHFLNIVKLCRDIFSHLEQA